MVFNYIKKTHKGNTFFQIKQLIAKALYFFKKMQKNVFLSQKLSKKSYFLIKNIAF
jgi:hypothetical protein